MAVGLVVNTHLHVKVVEYMHTKGVGGGGGQNQHPPKCFSLSMYTQKEP